MVESIDQKMSRIMARLAAQRLDCPVCESRLERAAILEYDGEMPRDEADRLARELSPCSH